MPETAVPASENFKKLQDKLRELFELDKADLDFGIYRILRQRHREITEFLDRHLEKTVTDALSAYQSEERGQLLEELRKAEDAARGAGIAPGDSPTVKALRARIDSGGGIRDAADEVYSHLYKVFRGTTLNRSRSH
jgi:adenine-specific DNA-methyltransferase